jgi:uncharacterized protein (PEP-CTERM system associated)
MGDRGRFEGVAALKRVTVAALAFCTIGEGAKSADLRLTTSVWGSESYNDNVNLAPKGSEKSDFITVLSPIFNLTDQSARFNLGLIYDPQLLWFAKSASVSLQQQLAGTAHAILYPELLFVDAHASISKQFISNAGPIGATTLTTNSNLQTVHAYDISPYVLHHYGTYASSESRYRFSSISVGGNGVAPIQTHELRQAIYSGEYFGRLGWTVLADTTLYERLGGTRDPLSNTTARDDLGRVDLSYLLYRGFSLIGAIGYERIKDPTLLAQPKGILWNAGFRYQPTPYASLSFTYGRRLKQTDYEANATYDIGPQLRVMASYTELYQTGESLTAANLNGQLTLNENGQLVNTLTGLPVSNSPFGSTISSPFGITSQAFIDKRFTTTVLVTRGRNNYSLTAYDDRASGAALSRQFGTVNPGFLSSNGNARTVGASATWRRQLWPNLTSNLTGNYGRTQFLDGSGRKDHFYVMSGSLNYAFSATLTGLLSALRSSTISNGSQNTINDDVITVSLQKSF